MKTNLTPEQKYLYLKHATQSGRWYRLVVYIAFANIVALIYPNMIIVGLFYLICICMCKLMGR